MEIENGVKCNQEMESEHGTKNDSTLLVASTSGAIKPDVLAQFMRDLANTRNHPYFFEGGSDLGE